MHQPGGGRFISSSQWPAYRACPPIMNDSLEYRGLLQDVRQHNETNVRASQVNVL